MKKHWYFISYYWCPQCGRGETYRKRRYGRRPKRYWSRHEDRERWDYCD